MRIVFKENPTEDDASMTNNFLNGDLPEFKERILGYYPEFRKLKKDNEVQIIRAHYDSLLAKDPYLLSRQMGRFGKAWNPKNDLFFNAVQRVIETKIPKRDVVCWVSLNPICPRDWKSWQYNMHVKMSDDAFVRISAHEIIHMFYFKKLTEEIPKIDKKTFDVPYREWELSEIIAPIVMNDPRISSTIGASKLESYVCKDETVLKINEIYKKHLSEKTSFIDFYYEAKKEYENITGEHF